MQGGFGITPAYAGKRWPASAAMVTRWDHPRVCGEESPGRNSRKTRTRSPPRMRGRVPNTCVTTTCCGITPAYAGKRSVKDLGAGGLWDHPRVCGEKLNKAIKLKHAGGSPPRMRGRVMRCSICQRGSGITPAYAGKRLPLSLSLIPCRDHPRVCGEESSGNHLPPLGRITPAYAGKSRKAAPCLYFLGDHPRVCGEKHHPTQSSADSQGSPPRMRGKGIKRGRFLAPIRITPAYAGKSLRRAPQRPLYRDHPRVCGEKFLTAKALCLPPGSPPRMRGKAGSVALPVRCSGITPAYAGKSTKREKLHAKARDHPRVCGEKAVLSSCCAS